MTADILKIDVDATWTHERQTIRKIRRSTIHCRIKLELFFQVAALLRTASDTDHPASPQFGDLTNQRSHWSSGGSDHKGLTNLRLADRDQSPIGDQSRHSEDAKRS